MPSVAENRLRWTQYSWDGDGHEWSPGGLPAAGEMLWWRGLLPRIHRHLPTGRALEIGPGFGRWTQHLLPRSRQLTIVDVTARCIDYCRLRFAAARTLDCWVNDGESLDMVPDQSIDFVFSFDSLVHADAAAVSAYVAQLARKLKPGGAGFIHHSNLGALADRTGRTPPWVARKHWRSESMSARLFRECCRTHSLECVSQELINWVGRSEDDREEYIGPDLPMIDALSTFVRPRSVATPYTRVYVNCGFSAEWQQLLELASLYDDGPPAGLEPGASAGQPAFARARRVYAQEGAAGLLQRLPSKCRSAAARTAGRAHRWWNARQVRRHEPIRAALRDRRCADCGRLLGSDLRCAPCRVVFVPSCPATRAGLL